MTCPVLGKIEKRYNDLKKGAEALAAAASAYHADLEAVLQLHQDLDKERLAFAKRAEVSVLISQGPCLSFPCIATSALAARFLERFRTVSGDMRSFCARAVSCNRRSIDGSRSRLTRCRRCSPSTTRRRQTARRRSSKRRRLN